ncbi:PLP-dependent transferase, partial [Candidatus Peregrinibacteria bacterium]|nr:PLP-dependent transferase [Candidatus Peregrinibacteria bacterium]
TEMSATFGSGLGAINAVIRQFVKPTKVEWFHFDEPGKAPFPVETTKGGKLVIVGSIYGGTTASMKEICEREGIEFFHMPISTFEKEGLPDDTDMVYFETSNNPTLRVVPIPKLVEEAKRVGAVTVCDNTFTPVSVKPADHDVDIVLHSMTKYLGGKSEDLGGVVSGKKDLVARLLDLHEGQRMIGGAVMAPRVAKEFLKNMANLPERLYRSTQNARAVAKIAKTFKDPEGKPLKVRTADSYKAYQYIRDLEMPETLGNGMVSIFLPSVELARSFANKMIERGVGKGAVSLGSTTTYYSIPSETTHSEMDLEEQDRVGITPGLLRISCGSEENLPAEVESILNELLEKPEPALAQ